MRQYLQKCFYTLQIKVLLVLSPTTLFNKISQQDWYIDTLQLWINRHLNGESLRVLDLGCASGYLTEYIFSKGCDVSGVDISKKMIMEALKKNTSIDFRIADACNLPFKEETFDVVSSASVINITSNPTKVVTENFRVCKQGGWVTFLFPIEGFTDDDLYRSKTVLGISGFSEAALITWHKSAPKMSVDNVKELLSSAGFSHCEMELYLSGMVASVSAQKDLGSND